MKTKDEIIEQQKDFIREIKDKTFALINSIDKPSVVDNVTGLLSGWLLELLLLEELFSLEEELFSALEVVALKLFEILPQAETKAIIESAKRREIIFFMFVTIVK